MAYSLRPTSATQAEEMARGVYDDKKITQIVALYSYLERTFPSISNALLLDTTGGNTVKVLPHVLVEDRSLDITNQSRAGSMIVDRAGLRAVAREAGARTPLSIQFGIGSSPGNGGIRYNMGNAAEGILAAAIAARFINKNTRVTANNIISVLNTLSSHERNGRVSHTFKSPNYKTAKESYVKDDDVRVDINLSPTNIALCFPNNYFSGDSNERAAAMADRGTIIGECADYANNAEISALAEVMYYNRQYDLIHINADGLGGELTTKVDIYLTINGQKEIEIPATYSPPKWRRSRVNTGQKLRITQISLKREVDQFAQVGGFSLETAQKVWGVILNEQIQNNNQLKQLWDRHDQGQYDTTAQQAGRFMTDVYGWANNRLQTKLSNTAWITHFVNKIHEFATKNEEHVQLVELKEGGMYEKYDMRLLLPALTQPGGNLTLYTNLVMSEPKAESVSRFGAIGLPTVEFWIRNNQMLNSAGSVISPTESNGGLQKILQVRHKIEWAGTNPAIRNYIEKKSGLHQYAGV